MPVSQTITKAVYMYCVPVPRFIHVHFSAAGSGVLLRIISVKNECWHSFKFVQCT